MTETRCPTCGVDSRALDVILGEAGIEPRSTIEACATRDILDRVRRLKAAHDVAVKQWQESLEGQGFARRIALERAAEVCEDAAAAIRALAQEDAR